MKCPANIEETNCKYCENCLLEPQPYELSKQYKKLQLELTKVNKKRDAILKKLAKIMAKHESS